MFIFIPCLLIRFRLHRLILIFSTIFVSEHLLLQSVRRVFSSFAAHEVYMYVCIYIYTRANARTHTHTHTSKAVKLTPNPKTQEPVRLQYNCPTDCVIAQQCSFLPLLPYRCAFVTERKYPARIK